MTSEDEFLKDAIQFLEEIGADISGVVAETNLFDEEVLDSLGSLAFIDFLEQQLGKEIYVEMLTTESIATLRNAYQLLLSLEQKQPAAGERPVTEPWASPGVA